MIDPFRHLSVFNPEVFGDKEVHIIGCGATGSHLAMQVAKLGVENIHLWDNDIIEEHNIANQLYGIHQIGQSKVEALADLIKQFCGIEPTVHNEKVTNQPLEDIVFLLTDTMSSRKEIWDNCIKLNLKIMQLFETRMGIDEGRIYSINPCNISHIEKWEESLCDDDEAQDSACGGRVTVGSTAQYLASLATWQFIKWFEHYNGKSTTLENKIVFCLRPCATPVSRAY